MYTCIQKDETLHGKFHDSRFKKPLRTTLILVILGILQIKVDAF